MNLKYEYIEGDMPVNLKFPAHWALYNHPDYLNIWPELPYISFYAIEKTKYQIAGSIHFQIIEDKAISLMTSPFGSLTFSGKMTSEDALKFIQFIEKTLKNRQVREIMITHYPYYYDPAHAGHVISSFGLSNFRITTVDVNHFIEISDRPFHEKIHTMEARRLKKCERAGFFFKEHANTDAELLFNKIRSFRTARKIPLNIMLKTLEKLVLKFPDKYKFFSVSNKDKIIAASICVKVNHSIFYHFLPAHDDSFNRFSPAVQLMQGIYNYAISKNYLYIDLGISSEEGTPQKGLIAFKERLGAIPASRFSIKKVIR